MQRILILLIFMTVRPLQAQVATSIYVDGKEQSTRVFKDTLRIVSHVNQLKLDWIANGYFFADLDSVRKEEELVEVFLHKGQLYKARLAGKRAPLLKEIDRTVKGFVNNGYPFVSVSYVADKLDDKHLDGVLDVEKGPEITYDSAYFFKEIKTSHAYIYQLLDIEPGTRFSEEDYQRIGEKIKRSAFLSLDRSTDISFRKNKAKIFLDVNEEAANAFQGILGLQNNVRGKSNIVGSLDLDLGNLFRTGKELRFFWERFGEDAQRLNLDYHHPFLLGSKISPNFRFDLLKQDTTFLNRVTGIGFSTFIAMRTKVAFGYEGTTASLLTTDINAVGNQNLADFNRRVYQASVSKGHQSALALLKEDVVWRLSVGAGRKEVNQNTGLADTFYDSIQLRSDYFNIEAILAYQWIVKKRQTIFHSLDFGHLENDQLLTNELYRVGGLKTLRGFDERSIFARSYALSRLELRSFFERGSYAFVFYDQLFHSRNDDWRGSFGTGMGFVLATSSGQFNFALAAGGSAQEKISFSNLKAHFGYISRF